MRTAWITTSVSSSTIPMKLGKGIQKGLGMDSMFRHIPSASNRSEQNLNKTVESWSLATTPSRR